MVNTEAPSYNSSRVQRAFRINSIEQARLSSKLQFLEKEKIHAIRVTNQDIRLVSLTLDYIQTCSGNSQEGIIQSPAPSSHGDASDDNDDEDPCFLYGERIASRRGKRFKRPPSGASSSRPTSSMGIPPARSRSKRLVRPQSSPQIRFDSSKAMDGTFVTEGPSGRSTPSEVSSEMSSVTRKLIEAQLGTDDRRSVFSSGGRARPERSQSAMSRVLRTEATLATLATDRKRVGSAESRKSSLSSHRGVGISEILNKADIHVMSAQAWKTHLQNKKGNVPATYAQQQRDILIQKKTMNDTRKTDTNLKINNFMSRFPTSRSILPG